MAILLYKRPSDRNWSGNPIHYQLYSAAAEADPTNKFEIKILFKRTDAADYSEIVTLSYDPVKGTADIDIEHVLDGLMEYEMPVPSNFESAFIARKMTGLFYIGWREITTAAPDPEWVTTESANAKFVIKGGIAWHKWRGDNYWVNYFDAIKPFFTWQLSGRLAGFEERMHLAWLNISDNDSSYVKIRRKLVFTDGTNYSLDIGCPVGAGEVAYIPAGAKQLKLDEVYPTKKILYWELQMWNISTDVAISQVFKFEMDNRNFYDVISLNYRNSIGGLDSFRLTGNTDFTLQREFTEQGQVVMHDYSMGVTIKGRVKGVNSTELLVYKADLGYLGKEEQDRLRDIHLQREVWWEQKYKWIPVMATTGTQKLKSNSDQLLSMPIEFSIASGGDNYYTPDSVDLQDGNLPDAVACTAVISDPEGAFTDPTWTVSWALLVGAPAKYFVSTPGVSGGAPHEVTVPGYVFPWLPVGDNVIKVQPICFIGGQYFPGAAKYVTITVGAACIPVGLAAPVVLPDATEDSAYSYTFGLTGTAPFILANISKPAWMNIAVVGTDIEITGTPDLGDVAFLLPISFDIKNCDGNNFISINQNIDVIGLVHKFKTACQKIGWTINWVTGLPYTLLAGSFPLAPNEQVIGEHSAYNGFVTVDVVNTTGTSAHLYLYVNGSVVETLSILDTHSYTFSSRNYLVGDVVDIRLSF